MAVKYDVRKDEKIVRIQLTGTAAENIPHVIIVKSKGDEIVYIPANKKFHA